MDVKSSGTAEFSLLDVPLVLLRHLKLVCYLTAAVLAISSVSAFVLPNIYVATARVVLPQQEGGLEGQLSGDLSSLAALVGADLGGGLGELYVAILGSRKVQDAIIDKYDLIESYDEDTRFHTYEELGDRIKFVFNPESNVLEISVEDESPDVAARMSNSFVDELVAASKSLSLGVAMRRSEFLKNRVALAKVDLEKSEVALERFKQKHGLVEVDKQAVLTIETLARLRAELVAKEIEEAVLKPTLDDKHYQLVSTRESIKQLKGQIQKIEEGSPVDKGSPDILIQFEKAPELATSYIRLMREYTVQEKIYGLLVQQWEIAKIQEAEDSGRIEMLDEAAAPDYHSYPSRSLIIVLPTLIALVFSIVFAFLMELVQGLPAGEQGKVAEIRKRLRMRSGAGQ